MLQPRGSAHGGKGCAQLVSADPSEAHLWLGLPTGSPRGPPLPAPRLFPGPGGPPPSFTPDILSHSGYPAVPAVGPVLHAKGPHPGLSLNSIFTSIAKK